MVARLNHRLFISPEPAFHLLPFHDVPVKNSFVFIKTELSSIFEYKQNTAAIAVICSVNFPAIIFSRYPKNVSIYNLIVLIQRQTVFLNYCNQ